MDQLEALLPADFDQWENVTYSSLLSAEEQCSSNKRKEKHGQISFSCKIICKYGIIFVTLQRIDKITTTMARPIKETPTLYGEDARRFAYAVEHPKPVSTEKVRRALKTYEQFKAIANFAL